MGNLFGGSKKVEPKKETLTEKDRAVYELKVQRIRLSQYRENAVRVIERETGSSEKPSLLNSIN